MLEIISSAKTSSLNVPKEEDQIRSEQVAECGKMLKDIGDDLMKRRVVNEKGRRFVSILVFVCVACFC